MKLFQRKNRSYKEKRSRAVFKNGNWQPVFLSISKHFFNRKIIYLKQLNNISINIKTKD